MVDDGYDVPFTHFVRFVWNEYGNATGCMLPAPFVSTTQDILQKLAESLVSIEGKQYKGILGNDILSFGNEETHRIIENMIHEF